MGISRSVTLLCAYYLKYGIEGLFEEPSVEDVLGYIRFKRSFVAPNTGFEKQLRAYHGELKHRRDKC
jgi:protein-tyrosine phosphatase